MPIEGGYGIPGDLDPGWWPLPAWPLALELDGHLMRLRRPDAARSLAALARGNWTAFVPGLLREDDLRHLDRRLIDPDDPFDLWELAALGRWTGAHVAGVPWWAAVQLAATAREQWPTLAGRAAIGGADLVALGVGGVLNACWVMLRESAESEEGLTDLHRRVFDARPADLEFADLVAPASVGALESAWAEEAAADFADFLGDMGGVFTLPPPVMS